MRTFFSGLFFLVVLTYLMWPYVHIYQFNDAVVNKDLAAFDKLVDIEAIRKVHKENIDWKINQFGGNQGNLVPDVMRQGARILGNTAVETAVNTNNLLVGLNQKGSVFEQMSFAFFESPTSFMIRVGELGRDPIHIQMTLQDWYWRVTAIYE